MSHFTVLVIGDEVEKQLQPYHEYECTGMLDEHVVFVDHTAEVKAEYETETAERIRLPNGELKSTYDDMFYRPATEEEQKIIGEPFGSGHIGGISYTTEYKAGNRIAMVKDLSGLEVSDVPYSEIYATVEEFATDYHGYEIHKEDGRIGSMTNPEAHWDWWVIGGRWSGFFKVKEDGVGQVGQPGAFDNEAKEGHADQLLKKDIDIQGMRRDARIEANATYDKFELVTAGLEIPPTWEEVRTSFAKEDIDEARKQWAELTWNKALREARLDPWGDDVHEYYCVGDRGGREEFVKRAVACVFVPFALVKDSVWYQKGDMGWWGMSTDEMTQDEWNEKVSALVDETDDDTLFTLVDCHI